MTSYTLHPCCRVRKESFGLLFYDLRGPRLLFAQTGDLLEPGQLAAGVRGGEGFGGDRLARFLADLARKGFLREQPVC
mgnify:CR=1 FL=1